MNSRISPRWRMLMLVIAVMAAASLACATPGGTANTAVPAAATNTTAPTDVPVAATDVPAPTDAPVAATDAPAGDDTGGADGGAKNTGGTTNGGTNGGTTGSANLVNASNAGDVEQLCGVQVTETQMRAVAASPINHEVAIFGFDKIPRIFDGDTCELLGGLEALGDSGWGMAYSPDGSVLAVGGGYQVNLYDAGNGAILDRSTVNAFVFKTVWFPTGEEIAVVGQNSSRIDVIDATTGSLYDPILTPDNVILWSIAFSPDLRFMVTGNAFGGVRVIDLDAGEIVFETTTKGAVLDLEFSPDSQRMAACNGSGHVYVWDTDTWDISLSSEISGDPVHVGGCQDGAFGADGSIYITAGADGYLNFYDSSEGTLLNYFWWDGLPTLESVSVTGDGELVAVALSDGGLGIFSLP